MGFKAHASGRKKIEEALKDKKYEYSNNSQLFDILSEICRDKNVADSSDTMKNFWVKSPRPGVSRGVVKAITDELNLDPKDIVEGWEQEEEQTEILENKDQNEINHQKFKEKFKESYYLTTLPLTKKQDIDKVWIPLGLKQMRTEQEFTYKDFLDILLEEGQKKRIAIIGEPGGGKTTQLLTIGKKLLEEGNNVIFISLADLKDQSLEDYLLEAWLKNALIVRKSTDNEKKDLCKSFKEGKTWLLLDGLDELPCNDHTDYLAKQIKVAWIAEANIILSCRRNIWTESPNELNYFEVYSNLEFSVQQRSEFIHKWFANVEQRNALITELSKKKYSKTTDLIKNPLMLNLVCFTWDEHKTLGGNRYELYEKLYNSFFDWEKNTQKEELEE